MKEILTLKPTMAEMQDGLVAYMEQVMVDYPSSGSVKVVPPAEWTAMLEKASATAHKDLDFILPSPILQRAVGERGAYQFALVALQDTTLREFECKSESREAEQMSMLRGSNEPQELERAYWKNISYIAPEYGADMPGSIFGSADVPWNINTNMLNVLSALDVQMPGVNSTYLYVGQMFSSFCWHVEDKDLFAVNFLHFGAPKTWYSVPVDHRQRFETLAQELFPEQVRECANFMRHKTSMISPALIEKAGIPIETTRQFPGEFVFNLPHGYHCGFSHGFNCAESINFATPRWFPIGRDSTVCLCEENPINIDVDALAHRYQCLILAIRKRKSPAGQVSAVDEMAGMDWADVMIALERYSKLLNVTDKDFENGGNVVVDGSTEEPEKSSSLAQVPRRRMAADTAMARNAAMFLDDEDRKHSAAKKVGVKRKSKVQHRSAVRSNNKQARLNANTVLPRQNLAKSKDVITVLGSEIEQNLAKPKDVITIVEGDTLFVPDDSIVDQPLVVHQPLVSENWKQRKTSIADHGGELQPKWLQAESPEPLGHVRLSEPPGIELSDDVRLAEPPVLEPLDDVARHGQKHPLDMKFVAMKKYLRSQSTILSSEIRPCRTMTELHDLYHSHPECHLEYGVHQKT